jgi:chromosome segregation ATPase
VNKTFQKTKAESKQILERSRHDLAAASEEIQKEYAIIEEVRLVYEKNLELAREQGLPEPDASGVDFRTVDELQAELETQRANLDMNLNTNPGVIEEYEKRKRDVRAFLVMIVLAPGY